MSPHLWVRAETKALERRSGLSPVSAQELVARGFRVTVEQSEQSCFNSALFAKAGCELAPSGSWHQAPDDAFILVQLVSPWCSARPENPGALDR